MKKIILFLLLILSLNSAFAWGFYAHKMINYNAVFLLHDDLFTFFRAHIAEIEARATDPDKLSMISEEVAVRHYLDLEMYPMLHETDTVLTYKQAIETFGLDSLMKHGTNPWHVCRMYFRLINAFESRDVEYCIITAARLGHYIADACTPLHNTHYYDGKTYKQKGIHSLWETGIPIAIAEEYNLFNGKVYFIENPLSEIFKLSRRSHNATDTVFAAFDSINKLITANNRCVYEQFNGKIVKKYTRDYAWELEKAMDYMVTRQMKLSIQMVACFWMSAWIRAGRPNMDEFEDYTYSKEYRQEQKEIDDAWKNGKTFGRPDPADNELMIKD